MIYAIYETATGRIDQIHYSNRGREITPGTGFDVVAMESGECDISTHYVDTLLQQVKPKTPLLLSIGSSSISADGNDSSTLIISDCAFRVLVFLGDQLVSDDNVDDGIYELSTDMPGQYRLVVDPVKYLKEEFTVEAIA